MFSHIDLAGLESSQMFGYAKDLPFLKDRPTLEFKPGLNIVFGPNGSGKSTVLRMLAESMCAFQGGVPKVTHTVLSSVGWREPFSDPMGVKVAHDGQAVVFCDPRQQVGLIGGAFDDDFFHQGVREAMAMGKQSHGQTTMRRADHALGVLLKKIPFPELPKLAAEKKATKAKDAPQRRPEDVIRERMAASIAQGQPSVILDEPEANYSLLWQARLWQILSKPETVKDFQIIVATHSAFALGIPHAHYIDVNPTFREEIELMLRLRFTVFPDRAEK